MDIEYKGGNCVVITHKKMSVITDPNLDDIGLKVPKLADNIQLVTQQEFLRPGAKLAVDSPGEYETLAIAIRGVQANASIDHTQSLKATMYTVEIDGTRIAIIGHVDPAVGDDVLEELGAVDVLVIPVGGNGYTLDAHSAAAIVRRVEPKLVIPTHYDEPDVTYQVTQDPLEPFLKEMSAEEDLEETAKLKLKTSPSGEKTRVVKLTRTR